ncbi:glycosyltransferase [Arthrobacter sp. OY3WO11]|uniref:glycosyltransferase n=1 Tax=Arthrobacter sp. OY3WO11 TaxID=1835723 RepID=UPI0007CFBBD9|nr:glycosyltransferase [Arthrobacter sp. OY3WO11]OAE02324.1 glycosyl transferase [Arthrobacter sp. OY3WO11]
MTSGQAPIPNSTRVSVCMASYRGALYIAEQLQSILEELGGNDEVVIVDDASPDNTIDVIRSIPDPRIRLIESPQNRGYVRSFEAAVAASRGEYIFLSDQDDVWIPGRVAAMVEALKSARVVASNFEMLGGGPRPWIPQLRSAWDRKPVANLLGVMVGYRAYYGCGMAFRRDMVPVFTPIPPYVRESHDLWLAICGNLAGSIAHLERPTLLRRLHESNETPAGFRSLGRIVAARIMLARLILEAKRRLKG